MRIALVSTSYPSYRGDPGGHFVETEALELARAGHEVHVIAPGSVGVEKGHEERSTVWRVGGSSLFGFPGVLARARENPLRLLQIGGFLLGAKKALASMGSLDRLIAHFVVPCGYPLAVRATGELEVVLHGSDARLLASLPAWIRTQIVRRLLEREARFRFVSERLQATMLHSLATGEGARVAERSRVEPAPISVDVAEEHVARCRTILGDGDRPRWVACARLIASKRVDVAIREAVRRGAQLTVIGDGPQRASLEALAAANQPTARFLGRLPRHEALAFIAAADKLVHTSVSEGAPTVIREARALGVPVLATASGDVARWAATDPGIEILVPRASFQPRLAT